MAVGTLLGIAAGARALGGIAAGGQTIAQSRQMFTRQDRKRLEELEAAREAGELGMSEAQREGMRGEIAAERGALLRSQESRALREAAAQPTVTGRDIFLREQLAQEQAAELAAAGEGLVTEADIAAKAAQEAEIAGLEEGRAARRAGIGTGVLQMLGGAAGAVAETAGQKAQMEFQAEMQAAQLEKELSDADLIRLLRQGQAAGAADPYAGRVG